MRGTTSEQQSSPAPIEFRRDLLEWFDRQQRDLPWRRTKDPYAIWVSEIMLQQTRVAAVLPYYERFLSRFPTYRDLAQAQEADVLAHWGGLGYYTRARNLHRAAKHLVQNGGFAADYDSIRALPGIGSYTAAAIASIAFGKAHPAVDGNVFRVLSRIYEDRTDTRSPQARKHFTALAAELLDPDRPGDFNQAVMELGATICLPRNPQCLLCPVRNHCRARQAGTQAEFPVRARAEKQVFERRTLFWVEKNDHVLAWRRDAGLRLMAGFWELPEKEQLPSAKPATMIRSFRHTITFHRYVFELARADEPNDIGRCEWLSLQKLSEVPVSTVFRKAVRAAKIC